MAVINKIIGNAVATDIEKTQEKLKDILVENEKIDLSFKMVRDRIIITNKRIILVDYQGATGRKVEYLSIPYKSIIYFAVETGGPVDLDFEFRIWVIGRSDPLKREMKKDRDLAHRLIRILTDYTT